MKNRNNMNRIRSKYIKVPSKIFEMNLSPGSITLYSYLLSGAEEFDPSIRWAAKTLNVSNNTVIKYYSELESKGIITCTLQGYKGVVSKWSFNPTEAWISNN